MKCRRWEPEIRRLWQRVRIDRKWGGAPSVRFLFGNERAIPALLEFLEKTKVGKMPGRILLAGSGLGRGGPRDFFLRVIGEEEEGTEVSSSEEEDGPGPPL